MNKPKFWFNEFCSVRGLVDALPITFSQIPYVVISSIDGIRDDGLVAEIMGRLLAERGIGQGEALDGHWLTTGSELVSLVAEDKLFFGSDCVWCYSQPPTRTPVIESLDGWLWDSDEDIVRILELASEDRDLLFGLGDGGGLNIVAIAGQMEQLWSPCLEKLETRLWSPRV
jgi:hypothetical protein